MKRRHTALVIGVAAIAALIVGCAAAIPSITTGDAERVGVPIDLLRDGRERYIAKCSGCHALYAPPKYTTAEWDREMEEMRERSRLTDEDFERITTFLHAFAKTDAPSP